MAIHPIDSDPKLPTENTTKRSQPRNGSPTVPSSSASSTSQSKNPGDLVNLSDEREAYEGLIHAIKQVPDIRQEKVEQIRKALESGQYRVSTEELADRIIQDTLANSTPKST